MIPFCRLFMWQGDTYLEVRSFPVTEMLGRTEIELADEWIEITNSVEWRERGRRPLKHGDIMQLGKANWVYIRTSDKLKDYGFEVKHLSAVPVYSIGRLMVAIEDIKHELV